MLKTCISVQNFLSLQIQYYGMAIKNRRSIVSLNQYAAIHSDRLEELLCFGGMCREGT